MNQLNDQFVQRRYSFRSNLLFVIKVIQQHQQLVIPAILIKSLIQAGMPFITIYLTKTVIDFFLQRRRITQNWSAF